MSFSRNVDIKPMYTRLLVEKYFTQNNTITSYDKKYLFEYASNINDGHYFNIVHIKGFYIYYWMAKKCNTTIFMYVWSEPKTTLVFNLIQNDTLIAIYLYARCVWEKDVVMSISQKCDDGNEYVCHVRSDIKGIRMDYPFIPNKGERLTIDYKFVDEFLNKFKSLEIEKLFTNFDAIAEILFHDKSMNLPKWFDATIMSNAIDEYIHVPRNLTLPNVVI